MISYTMTRVSMKDRNRTPDRQQAPVQHPHLNPRPRHDEHVEREKSHAHTPSCPAECYHNPADKSKNANHYKRD